MARQRRFERAPAGRVSAAQFLGVQTSPPGSETVGIAPLVALLIAGLIALLPAGGPAGWRAVVILLLFLLFLPERPQPVDPRA